MKKLYFLLFTLLFSAFSFAQTTVFINELHYDNSGGDVDEGVEIAGPAGTDLTGWSIEKYNGSNGTSYGNEALSGTITDQDNGYGTLGFTFAANALQNGAPDAIALVNNSGVVVQFLSYEGSLTASGGPADGMTSEDIGVAETSGTAIGESLQLTGTGDTYEEFTWSGPSAQSSGAVNSSQSFSSMNTASITITAPSDAASFAPGTTSVDIAYTVVNAPGTATVDITVNGTTTNGITDNPFSVTTINGQSYTVTVELIDGGVLDSDQVTFSIENIAQVADIAALRAATEGEFYELTGEALITFQQSFRNQKFIEDSSGGILIDDSSGNVTTTYAIGDGITGIVGQLTSFGGMMQFAVSEDPGAASTTGNTLTPQMVSLLDLATNPENYESELVMVTGVTMENSTPNFSGGSEHGMSQSGDMFNFRSTFFDADYADQNGIVPLVATDIVGIVNERSGSLYFLTARSSADFSEDVLSTDNFNSNSFSLYPNPTNTGFVNINSTNNETMGVQVFDILGKQVKNENLINNRLNVSDLNTGIYIVKITQNNASITKKLVIK
ncbi:T9SS type A sorting domain-containing protein [Winogradskyella sp. PE311]|uniref:T9SS type A sorting domain-containing protein n=1 Tax=Winogradskyella sp. PE311 TaxID=3366943 RepID=UPI0039807BEA